MAAQNKNEDKLSSYSVFGLELTFGKKEILITLINKNFYEVTKMSVLVTYFSHEPVWLSLPF